MSEQVCPLTLVVEVFQSPSTKKTVEMTNPVSEQTVWISQAIAEVAQLALISIVTLYPVLLRAFVKLEKKN